MGIYVHIPFCMKKCNYCDFNSYENCFSKEQAYFDALFSEIREKGKALNGAFCDTVYIGGGTPTAVNSENIAKLMVELLENFNISKDAEITIECNPKTAGEKDFERYIKSGINRISIGLQSTHNDLLKTLGRIHKKEDFLVCLKNVKDAGVENISADLMFALPDQNLKMWEETLLEVAELGLSHISCYGLKIEEGTPFYNQKLNIPDEDLNGDMYDLAVKILEDAGFLRYEISNFAKCGKESRHNLKYWSLMPYIGLGAGAYSSIDCERYRNPRSLDEYISDSGKKEDYIKLSEEEKRAEFMFMGLRKTEGISTEEFKELFGADIFDVYKKPLEKYIKNGALKLENDRLYISENMLYISNGILCDFV